MRRLIPALVAWLRNPEVRVTVTPLPELEALRAEVETLRAEKAGLEARFAGSQNLYFEAVDASRRYRTENELLRKQIQRMEHEIYLMSNPLPPVSVSEKKKKRKSVKEK